MWCHLTTVVWCFDKTQEQDLGWLDSIGAVSLSLLLRLTIVGLWSVRKPKKAI